MGDGEKGHFDAVEEIVVRPTLAADDEFSGDVEMRRDCQKEMKRIPSTQKNLGTGLLCVCQ